MERRRVECFPGSSTPPSRAVRRRVCRLRGSRIVEKSVLVVSCGFCPRSRARLRSTLAFGRWVEALRYGVGLSPWPAGINSALPSRVGGELLLRGSEPELPNRRRWTRVGHLRRGRSPWLSRGGSRVAESQAGACPPVFLTRCVCFMRVRVLIVNDKLTGCVAGVKDNCFSPGCPIAGEKAPHLHYEYEL